MNFLNFIFFLFIFVLSHLQGASASQQQSMDDFQYSQIETKLHNSKIKKLDGNWNLGLISGQVKEEVTSATAVGLQINSNLNYHLTKSLFVKVQPGALFQTGHAQSLYGDFEPVDQIYMREALVDWKSHSLLGFQAGVLNQNRLENPLLIADKPFPAIEMNLFLLSNQTNQLTLSLQEAVPTSYTLESKAQVKEDTPSFQSISLKFDSQILKESQFSINLTHFAYQNLPSTVAEESRLKGNQVNSIYQFENEYSGYSVSSFLLFPIWKFISAELSGALIENQKTNRDNKGQLLKGQLNVTRPHWTAKAYIGTFKNERESSPAYYNSSYLGNNNRNGYLSGLKVDFTQLGFSIRGEFVNAKEIYDLPFQSERKSLILTLETSYEVL